MADALTIQEINETFAKMEKAVRVFSERDRKKLLRRAARPVRKTMRNKVRVSKRVHYRYLSGGQRIAYHPGNYRRSIKTLTQLKRSRSVFVGPNLGGQAGVYEYGRPGQPTDAYYYAMAYGGLPQYRSLLLNPAARQSASAAVREFRKGFVQAFGTRAAQQGLNVG